MERQVARRIFRDDLSTIDASMDRDALSCGRAELRVHVGDRMRDHSAAGRSVSILEALGMRTGGQLWSVVLDLSGLARASCLPRGTDRNHLIDHIVLVGNSVCLPV